MHLPWELHLESVQKLPPTEIALVADGAQDFALPPRDRGGCVALAGAKRGPMSERPASSHPCIDAVPIFAAIFVLLVASWTPVRAQETTGAIEGTVEAPDGKPLAGIEIVATTPAPRIERKVITNRDGGFRITALPLGEYAIAVHDPKFEPAKIEKVVVRLGQTTGVPPVRLAPLGSLAERVTVVGKAPPIDPANTTTGGNVSAALFDNLPVQRDYQSIAALLPNVSVSYLGDPVNIGGATGEENRYFVDGIDMTDPERALGGTVLPPDFIREVEVKLGGYEAEYRSGLGGVVNVVTPSGGDRLSGKLIGYWTGHVLSQEARQSPAELQQENFAQYDLGFSLSGPIARDRAWFFLAYDPMVQKVDTDVPGVGRYEDSTIVHRFAGKVDWRWNGSNSLAMTVLGDPLHRDGVGDFGGFSYGAPVSLLNPDPYLRRIEGGGVGISLRGTHVVGPRLLIESALSNQWRKDVNLPATDRGRTEAFFVDAETGVWSGGSGESLDVRNTQLTASAKATWSVGRHQIKAGAEYRTTEQRYDAWGVAWTTRFSDTSFISNSWFANQGSVYDRTFALFLQDAWRLGTRLVVNAGVRWTNEGLEGEPGVSQRLEYEWQPRVGFVYQPGRVGTQRIYGSAGRYYQELPTGGQYNVYLLGWTGRVCSYDHDPRVDPTGGDCAGVPVLAASTGSFRGYYYDDYSLGYQRRIGDRHRAGVRAIYRTLGDAIEDGFVTATGTFAWGNPGRGALAADFPRASRVYRALEFTFEGQPTPRSSYLASYVLSENRGNYTGLFNTDFEWTFPGANGTFDYPDTVSDGLLPNDRTHVAKGAGFYRFDTGLTLGASVLWQSGTPLSEFGCSAYGYPNLKFLRPRGSAGRTPSIFDLSLRADYTFRRNSTGRVKPRLILDVYHLFGGRKAVDYDQIHYFNVDGEGNQINPNPTYRMATRYYPPTTARLGLEVTF